MVTSNDTKRLRSLRRGVYAVDVSVWLRCDAECSPERGYYSGLQCG
jgi:hypothetical protein